jgi:hypothetical protein
LAFDCAAATELIQHDHNGWLVPDEDPQRYVLNALEITRRSSTLREARQHTASSVAPWDWHQIANQVESIFRSVVKVYNPG